MPKGKHRIPASHIIDELADGLDGDRVSVGDLLARLEGRGIGLLLVILALPICIPNVPGISTVFGLLLLPPSVQMLLHHKALWMPGFVKRWDFKGDDFRKVLKACAVALRKVEYLARPRWTFLTRGLTMIYLGFQTFILALILLLPMPGANVIPGVAVVLTGLAILQRDGLFMLAGSAVAAGAVAYVYYFAHYVVDFTVWAYQASVGWIDQIAQNLAI